MTSTKKKIAIVGAGPSGLVSTKSALEYGYDVTTFEATGSLGGLWNYDAFKTDIGYQIVENYNQPIPGVYKSLRMNTSSEISAFSDFPNRYKKKAFLDHEEYLDYQRQYARNFNLLKNIKLNSHVKKIWKEKCNWVVQYQSCEGNHTEEKFDLVMMATGPFNFPFMPELKGLRDNYKGVVLHSSQVRDEAIFQGKRLLVIGGGYSGCEIAVGALGNDVSKIFFCMTNSPQERNHWAMDRWVPDIYTGEMAPWDHALTRYEYLENPEMFNRRLRSWLFCTHAKDDKEQLRFPGDRLALTEIKALKANLQSGRIKKVSPIKEFTTDGVKLINGETVNDIDFVVLGTGFVQRYPMIDQIWEPSSQIKCELYKYLLHPNPDMDGLSFICAVTSPVPLFPVMEMQARWICNQLFTRTYDEQGHLFTETEREALRDNIRNVRAAQPEDLPYNYLVDGPGYVYKLSEDIDCSPPTFEELIKSGEHPDLELAVALKYGPLIGAQYRIRGPGKWDGAKDWMIEVAKSVLGAEKFNDTVNSIQK